MTSPSHSGPATEPDAAASGPDSGTVASLMAAPVAVFRAEETVAGAIERLRAIPPDRIYTYGYVTDGAGRLTGVVVMRALMLADRDSTIGEVMEGNPFFLRPDMTFLEAMRETMVRHFPEYPVCDADGQLIGVVRGQALFRAEAISLTSQPAEMVGVTLLEEPSTPYWRSVRSRFGWLQANLLTAFIASAVVGLFQDLIDRIVLLAVFLPVLSGQSLNTGAQALSVALRALTLGRLDDRDAWAQLSKETLLGLLNGAVGGLLAGGAMLAVALAQGNPSAAVLGLVVFVAMTLSAVVSGIIGGILPLALRRIGADPAVASSIILSTVTDIVSMGSMLLLALLLIG